MTTWYRAGTVSLTNGSASVVGSGTQFVQNVAKGAMLVGPDGRPYEILTVVSATALTLAENYAGASNAAAPYAIAPTFGVVNDAIDIVTQWLANQQTYVNLIGTAVQSTRQVNTGAGMTGGGSLSGDLTLALTGQALALHTLNGNGLVARTAAGAFGNRTITGGNGITVENGDGVSGNPTVALSETATGTLQADAFSTTNGSFWVGANTTGFQNNTSASMQSGRFVVNTGSINASVFVHNSLNTSASVAAFLFGKQELNVGSIVFTSTGVIYNQTSDRRQKDEISDLSVEDAMAAVRSYQCRTFRWISTGQRDTGFIAQEFATVSPGAVFGDPDGDEMMTMQASNAKTIAEMMRCIQYLLVEIEALKSA